MLLQYLTRFGNPLVIILLVASAVLALTGDFIGFSIISTIVLISVTLDFVQEHRAGEAAERLRQSVAVRVRVLRNREPTETALEVGIREFLMKPPSKRELAGAVRRALEGNK